MSFKDNIQFAKLANDLNIDILEAGFPAASKMDFNIVNAIAKEIDTNGSNMIVAGLCQMKEEQLLLTMRALEPLRRKKQARVHIYLPVDPVLAKSSLKENNQKLNIQETYRLIKLAYDKGFQVQFSAEGYSMLGDQFSYVSDLFNAAVHGGATIINCPDTIGGASIHQGSQYFIKNIKKHANIIKSNFPDKKITWSVHCHNDLGMALSNSINAVFDGTVKQVEGCINGVGERAGNMALEQFFIYLHKFGNDIVNKYYTTVNLSKIQVISNFISDKMLPRQPHSPIVGDNSAKHSSGGHTNAILKNPLAYQPFDPKLTGNSISFIFGPLSGGNLLQEIINNYGYKCPNTDKARIAQLIKDKYSHRRKGITDKEVIYAFKEVISPLKLNRVYRHPTSKTYHIDFSIFGLRQTQSLKSNKITYATKMIKDFLVNHKKKKSITKNIDIEINHFTTQFEQAHINLYRENTEKLNILANIEEIIKEANSLYIDNKFKNHIKEY